MSRQYNPGTIIMKFGHPVIGNTQQPSFISCLNPETGELTAEAIIFRIAILSTQQAVKRVIEEYSKPQRGHIISMTMVDEFGRLMRPLVYPHQFIGFATLILQPQQQSKSFQAKMTELYRDRIDLTVDYEFEKTLVYFREVMSFEMPAPMMSKAKELLRQSFISTL